MPEPLTGGTYLVSATMLQGVTLSHSGRWNQEYEQDYQHRRQAVAAFRELWKTPEGQQRALAAAPAETWNHLFWEFETLRFSRLTSFLRQREPDDEIGFSILVYRLSDTDIAAALDARATELLPISEPHAEDLRRDGAVQGQ